MLTVKQSAKSIGLSASKMYELIASHRLAHYRIDGKILVDEADLTAYLKTCRVGADAKIAVQSSKPFKHLNATRLASAWKQHGASPSP